VYKAAIPLDSLYVEIRSGSVTGTLIATSCQSQRGELSTTSPTNYTAKFVFGSQPLLSAGNKILSRYNRTDTSPAPSEYFFRGSNTSGYAGGGDDFRSGGTWNGESATGDIAFRISSPSTAADAILLEDGVSYLLLEGSTTSQSLGGSLTPAGSLIKDVSNKKSGSSTATGAMVSFGHQP
jgi:hypothetical protein